MERNRKAGQTPPRVIAPIEEEEEEEEEEDDGDDDDDDDDDDEPLNMFLVVFHPLSGAHNTVSTVSGIQNSTATCRERD